jgi:tRNA threonylcarbamoyladenosine biosynthesis protein TsaB
MIVLGINTSSQVSTVGLMKDNVLVSELMMDMQWNWLSDLFPVIQQVIQNAKVTLDDVNLFSIVLGPGTWTGIRIGVTTVKTLAYTLNCPVIGISALDVLAYNVRFVEQPVYSLVDAGNNRVYLAGYHCTGQTPERFSDYHVSNIDSLANHLEPPCILVGDGCLRYGEELGKMYGDRAILAPPSFCRIRVECLIEATIHQYKRRGPDDVFALAPMYLQETVYRANPGTMLNLTKV